jgi:hypothetical protein
MDLNCPSMPDVPDPFFWITPERRAIPWIMARKGTVPYFSVFPGLAGSHDRPGEVVYPEEFPTVRKPHVNT